MAPNNRTAMNAMLLEVSLFSILLFFVLISSPSIAQININVTNADAEQVMMNQFDPADYSSQASASDIRSVVCALQNGVSTDSLFQYISSLQSFGTRNPGSDTSSNNQGIGAARRWIFSKFQQFSARRSGRLLPSFMTFESSICGQNLHKNIFSVLPGRDTSRYAPILLMAHMDSRCDTPCDTSCFAPGADDNGSGTALVIELARVLSKFEFDRTIIFLTTVAEEQGLFGADAFSDYLQTNGVPLRALLNNDIVGGVICGETSSPPSCPFEGHVDSTHVRVFSFGDFASPHKSLGRWIKLQYREMLLPQVNVPMTIELMDGEDRQGRGGDHVRFRQKGFTGVRFTEANENGNGDPSTPGYSDRQHTSDDVIGMDTNNDQSIDSFFVDFNYLKRNTVINGMAASLLAMAPPKPEFILFNDTSGMFVEITNPSFDYYKVGVREQGNHNFKAVYKMQDTARFPIPGIKNGQRYNVSVAAMNNQGIESLFAEEEYASAKTTIDSVGSDYSSLQLACDTILAVEQQELSIKQPGVKLTCCLPNPFNRSTILQIDAPEALNGESATLMITDISGRVIDQVNVDLRSGQQSISYQPSHQKRGLLFLLLKKGERILGSGKALRIR